jgi:carboxylesterase
VRDLTADEAALGFQLPGDRGAVLCLHGFTGTPYSVLPVAQALSEAGFRVRAPRLAGHGETVEALQHTRWPDWLGSARGAFDVLSKDHEKVFVCGLSMGALLSLAVAHERGARVAGVVAMATPLKLDWLSQTVLRIVRRLPFSDLLPFRKKKGGPDVSDPGVAAAMPSYDRVPMPAAASLLDGQEAVIARVGRLSVPVLVQHGRQDHVAPVENAERLYALLRTADRRLITYPRSWHILPLDVEHETVARDVVEFVERVTTQAQEVAL